MAESENLEMQIKKRQQTIIEAASDKPFDWAGITLLKILSKSEDERARDQKTEETSGS